MLAYHLLFGEMLLKPLYTYTTDSLCVVLIGLLPYSNGMAMFQMCHTSKSLDLWLTFLSLKRIDRTSSPTPQSVITYHKHYLASIFNSIVSSVLSHWVLPYYTVVSAPFEKLRSQKVVPIGGEASSSRSIFGSCSRCGASVSALLLLKTSAKSW